MVARLCRSILALALALPVLASLPGCKDKEAASATSATAPDDGDTRAADDLLARRDALMKSRQKLQDEQQRLEVERTRIIERGGDPSEVDKQSEELRSQVARIATDDAALTDQMQAFLEQVKTVRVIGDSAQQVAAREATTATREKAIASREDRVAQREATLADRERALAQREKDTCGVGGGTTTTIIQQVDPKGAKYGKRDVEPLLKKARQAMARKGVLASDLPAQAQGLEREATKAMADGDYGPARFAAQQLLATVEGQKIDRGFISAKIARLSSAMKGRKLDAARQQEVDERFRDATAKYGDGDYASANKQLNQIWRAID